MNNYAVDRVKWSKMSIFEQMGNIYSEIGRSFNAKQRGDSSLSQQALVRALDLFDATVEALVSKKSPKTKEVLRAKDQYLTVYFENDIRQQKSLEKYFLNFAIAARR